MRIFRLLVLALMISCLGSCLPEPVVPGPPTTLRTYLPRDILDYIFYSKPDSWSLFVNEKTAEKDTFVRSYNDEKWRADWETNIIRQSQTYELSSKENPRVTFDFSAITQDSAIGRISAYGYEISCYYSHGRWISYDFFSVSKIEVLDSMKIEGTTYKDVLMVRIKEGVELYLVKYIGPVRMYFHDRKVFNLIDWKK